MKSLLISIMVFGLLVCALLVTFSYMDKPFELVNDRVTTIQIDQNFTDFGFILESSSELNNNLVTMDDIAAVNDSVPLLNGVSYSLIHTLKGETIIYNSNVSDKECLLYAKYILGNNNLTINDISQNLTLFEYIEIGPNRGCYKSIKDSKNYIVYIYQNYTG